MKRIYVIMCDNISNDEYTTTEPVDVVSSLTEAEELCFQYEAENSNKIYYYREVISSEG